MAATTVSQKGLIWPERRNFLKRAPLVFGATALGLMPKVAAASLLKPSANPKAFYHPPTQPTPAAANGFNSLSFFDDFLSPSTIDFNNTLQPGFNWYTSYNQGTNSGGTTVVLPASALSMDASVLTITAPTQLSGNPYCITTMGCTGVSPNVSLVGSVFKPQGAYFEARVKFIAGQEQNPGWPAWWLFDNGLTLALANSQSFPSNGFCEIDLMEGIYFGGPPPELQMADWTWYSPTVQYKQTVYNPNIGGSAANDNGFHTYGCLWLPQAKNGGTGIIQRYFDGVYQTATDVTYTTSGTSAQQAGTSQVGWMSAMDFNTSGFAMQIGCGKNWPIYIDYVQAWQ